MIKNFQIVFILNSLKTFLNKKLPQKISYAIIRNNQILRKNYEIYEQALQKIFSNYDSYIKLDKNGKYILDENEIPIVEGKMKESYYKEIEDLLNTEVDIKFYIINENFFNYDDKAGLYDVLTPQEILQLQEILCKKKDNRKKSKDD